MNMCLWLRIRSEEVFVCMWWMCECMTVSLLNIIIGWKTPHECVVSLSKLVQTRAAFSCSASCLTSDFCCSGNNEHNVQMTEIWRSPVSNLRPFLLSFFGTFLFFGSDVINKWQLLHLFCCVGVFTHRQHSGFLFFSIVPDRFIYSFPASVILPHASSSAACCLVSVRFLTLWLSTGYSRSHVGLNFSLKLVGHRHQSVSEAERGITWDKGDLRFTWRKPFFSSEKRLFNDDI